MVSRNRTELPAIKPMAACSAGFAAPLMAWPAASRSGAAQMPSRIRNSGAPAGRKAMARVSRIIPGIAAGTSLCRGRAFGEKALRIRARMWAGRNQRLG